MGVGSGRFPAVALLLLAAVVFGACTGRGGDGTDAGISRAPAGEPTPATTPEPPPGWERFEEGEFAGYMPAHSEVIYLPVGDVEGALALLDELDEETRQLIEVAMATMTGTDLFFIFFGSEVEFGGNVNLAVCEMNGQPIPTEGQIRLGYRLLGVPFEELGEVTHGEATADIFRTRLSEMFETYQVVLTGTDCNLLVTLTLIPGDYEGFAPNFGEFIRLLEFRGEAALE